MIRFITVVCVLIVMIFSTSFKTPITPDKDVHSFTDNDKWKKLFDGKTFNGWHLYGKTYVGNCWQIEQGALHLIPVEGEANKGDLVTDESFENFDLQLEWKVAPKSNSGIIFLIHEDTSQFKETYFTGLEMQVLDNTGADDNKKENHLAGTLYDLIGKAADSKPKVVGEWNKSEIICNNGQLKLYLNGSLVVATKLWNDDWKQMIANSKFKKMPAFGTYKSGRIALQYHGGEVWYRNIRIKKLNLK